MLLVCLLWIIHTSFRYASFWCKNREVYPFLAKPLYFVRGHSLVELTEHGDSAADIDPVSKH